MSKRKHSMGDTSESQEDSSKIPQSEVKPQTKETKPSSLKLLIHNNKYTIILLSFAILTSIFYISFDNCNVCLKILSRKIKTKHSSDSHMKKYWIYGKNAQIGHIEHFMLALNRLGYSKQPLVDDWDLLWAEDPFNNTELELKNLKSFQRVNHFPGYQELYDKVAIARSGVRGIPTTFKLPEQSKELLQFAKKNNKKTFIYKYPRDLFNLRKADELQNNLEHNAVVQEFIDNPLLFSNTKFDIGVFVLITSINPLRVYMYNADVGLRTTANNYEPVPNVGKSYLTSEGSVVNDLEELAFEYSTLQATAKQSLNSSFGNIVINSEEIWYEIEEIIRDYIVSKEKYLIKQSEGYKSTDNFFEMMRFNFLITTSWNVYLMSINPFPNLLSYLYQWDVELYDHVLYNFFGLVGIAPKVQTSSLNLTKEMTRIESDEFNLGVYPEECLGPTCKFCGNFDICKLCKKCLKQEDIKILLRAHSEQLNKGDCKRIFPPETDRFNLALPLKFNTYSKPNRFMHLWFKGKCMLNSMWCK